MKIMFYIGSMGKGGAERVISILSNFFVNKYKIIIVTTVKSTCFYKIDNDIELISLDKNNDNKNFLIRNINRELRLKKIIFNKKPDIIITFLPEPSYRVLMLQLKIPIIVSIRNDPKIEYNNTGRKLIMKILYKKANGFVFQTEDAKKYFSRKIQEKSIIIFNPLSAEFDKAPYDGTREKIIVNVGRLEKQKNQKLLIKSFNNILVKYPDYKLYIYGEGTERKYLQELIDELKLTNNVILKGISNNIKSVIYKKSLFVLSSNYEGMPNSLIEAMALGLPVISTDCPCGGPKALIENNVNGILVSPNNIDELTQSIEKVLENPKYSKKIGIRANMIYEKLNENVICNEWDDYIKKTINICKIENKK